MPEGVGLVLSVVSHGQRSILLNLLADLQHHVRTPFRLVLTENITEEPVLDVAQYSYPIDVVRNAKRKGFGENHNSAMARSESEWFCVLNPDIRLQADPFPLLCQTVGDSRIGIVSPLVTNSDLQPEDHARSFPSAFTLLRKALGFSSAVPPPSSKKLFYPDWVAGMFMFFRTQTLRSVGGFDERYFLYYEDVDLCARLRDAGYEVAVRSDVAVIHDARRESRRNLRYAFWHLSSALRFFAGRPKIALGLREYR